MQLFHRRCFAVISVFLIIALVLIIDSFPIALNYEANYDVPQQSSQSRISGHSNVSAVAPTMLFFQDFESWIESGYTQYGEFTLNDSLTAEVIVGTGERYEDIQGALDAGYTCIYLKKQRFNVTKPITPPKEDFYIVSNSAEITAIEPVSAIFDIRKIRYAHLDGLFINGNGLAQKCIDAMRTPSQVPMHQIRNCKIWGATFANVDFTGCEDSLIFNCWIDGRKINDTPDALTEYGVKIGEFADGFKTGGQVNLIHCLSSFHRKADVFIRNIAQLKLANCLLASKSMWSNEFEAHLIAEGGTGDGAVLPVIELVSCWVENGVDGNVPNILIRNHMMSKLTIIGGTFYTDNCSNIYSDLNPCAETITLLGALFENNPECGKYNVVAAAQKLVSVGNTYNWNGIDKTGLASYFILDRDSTETETKTP